MPGHSMKQSESLTKSLHRQRGKNLDIPEHADFCIGPVTGKGVPDWPEHVVGRHQDKHETERQNDTLQFMAFNQGSRLDYSRQFVVLVWIVHNVRHYRSI